jgi:pimeloyl-ACP methyl ester carboxylesterase
VLGAIPRSYVFTARDRSIPPALQRRMIADHPCRQVVELDADHAPFLSATGELVTALLELATATASAGDAGSTGAAPSRA